ncbi:MAG: hypothetical protein Q9222_000787 [Ikaeria aurantiellina]
MESESRQSTIRVHELLPHIIDQRAVDEPASSVAAVPTTSHDHSYLWTNVNYQQFANAINGAAWWIHKTIHSSSSFETLAYIGPNDLRYPILILGAVKAGFQLLLISPRNSIAGNLHLFETTSTTALLTTEPSLPPVAPLLKSTSIKTHAVPGLDHLLHRRHAPFIYKATFPNNLQDPLVVLHTSGTTGLPKPVTWTHGFVDAFQAAVTIQTDEGAEALVKQDFANKRGAGLGVMLFDAIFLRCVSILAPPIPPTAEGTMTAISQSKAKSAFLASFILEEISKQDNFLDMVEKLDYVVYGGAPLSRPAGELLNARTRLGTAIGATEFLVLQGLPVTKDDWMYIRPHSSMGLEFRHYTDDMYEAVIVRSPLNEPYQSIWHVFPDLQEYHTNDLYTRHPLKDELWTYTGRADDLIVFATGEKINPTHFESVIASHPEVRAALVTGSNRFQAALLIERVNNSPISAVERAKCIERIWPTIEKANRDLPGYAKILQSHVLLIDPEKLMQRSGKGSVQRQLTAQSYQPEIDALYRDADSMDLDYADTDIDISSKDKLQRSITNAIQHITALAEVGNDDDFFKIGMDSLQVIRLIQILRSSLRHVIAAKETLVPTLIYGNPTVRLLTNSLWALYRHTEEDQSCSDDDRGRKIQSILAHYASLIPNYKRHTIRNTKSDLCCVLITGSTGNLGSYLLSDVVDHHDVDRIYCLDRSPQAIKIHLEAQQKFEDEIASKRLQFLTGHVDEPSFGLTEALYEELLSSTTIVVHNAWQVDFNVSVSSLASTHLQGLVNLIAFSMSSLRNARIVFHSSISSVINVPESHRPIKEEPATDLLAAAPSGYAESKLIAEQLLTLVSDTIPVTIIHIGQIAGPVLSPGLWPRHEWFPSLIVSSVAIDALPSSLGSLEAVTWVPIDLLSPILWELALLDHTEPSSDLRIFHAVNPHGVAWHDLLPVVEEHIRRRLPRSKELTIVAFDEWETRLRERTETVLSTKGVASDGLNIDLIPAMKLLDFFEECTKGTSVELSTDESTRASKGLSLMKPVSQEWLSKWIEEILADGLGKSPTG